MQSRSAYQWAQFQKSISDNKAADASLLLMAADVTVAGVLQIGQKLHLALKLDTEVF